MPAYECITVENESRVTTVTLNRPRKRNAMSPQLNDEMLDALTRLSSDPETDVLVLTGAGESFSAGMDLKEYFRETEDDPVLSERTKWTMREWSYSRLRFFPRVTIAAVNGWCFGGAFMPLISCDLAIAADEARFGLSEVNWGILPGGLVTRDIALSLGYRDALYYALTGKTFGGQRAREIGLVNESVPRAELDDAVRELTTTLLALNPYALRATKEALRHSATMDYEQATDYLGAKAAQLARSDPERGRAQGLSQFLDTKEFKPGLGAYRRDGSGA
ncbi:p-hydroxycinnamoyl CoA hydratase/lyase [Microbacterium betulae]|uniref:p-hydroxycinnamoyl CoA hydratase/lyase n=1 Tax=Microbacterium betulae TaxID=2981139 RepID=A0AA97FID3_9MICO|nr:p-hydroxycinnamoyl CoA hydratase/lyase [Microbacterium sp. AB]WOF22850.1 p-hydroxycinnamoyl CoA hydratase/lyase [Microbacterium sp. AB]